MTKINITDGRYRNQELTGLFTLVQGYTPWGGSLDGAGKRRVGTAGAGYVKVTSDEGRTFKVTVAEGGFAVLADITPASSEIADLTALIPTLTGSAAKNARRRLARRVAKAA